MVLNSSSVIFTYFPRDFSCPFLTLVYSIVFGANSFILATIFLLLGFLAIQKSPSFSGGRIGLAMLPIVLNFILLSEIDIVIIYPSLSRSSLTSL